MKMNISRTEPNQLLDSVMAQEIKTIRVSYTNLGFFYKAWIGDERIDREELLRLLELPEHSPGQFLHELINYKGNILLDCWEMDIS